jgi:hypothetical protein
LPLEKYNHKPKGEIMTRQEMFDKVWEHFVVNKQPLSRDSTNFCFYRGPGGEKCAAGILIPDELYDSGMESMKASHMLRQYPKVADALNINHDDMVFLDDLQAIHDNSCDLFQIQDLLVESAEHYGLKVPCTN